MSVQSDFQAYTNELGFVSNAPNGSSGNDLLFTAEARLVRLNQGAWTNDDQAQMLSNIHTKAELSPGLYTRPGWTQDQEDPDDYYGLATMDPNVAQAILSYGQSHFWYFKTVSNPAWFEPIFFRFPALIAHVKWCAGHKPNLFLRLYWAACVAYSGSLTSQDPWLLNNLLISVAGNKGFIEKLATKIYKSRLKKIWGTLGNVYAAYFGNDKHPLAVYNNK